MKLTGLLSHLHNALTTNPLQTPFARPIELLGPGAGIRGLGPILVIAVVRRQMALISGFSVLYKALGVVGHHGMQPRQCGTEVILTASRFPKQPVIGLRAACRASRCE
jgi:hypothetical protein